MQKRYHLITTQKNHSLTNLKGSSSRKQVVIDQLSECTRLKQQNVPLERAEVDALADIKGRYISMRICVNRDI